MSLTAVTAVLLSHWAPFKGGLRNLVWSLTLGGARGLSGGVRGRYGGDVGGSLDASRVKNLLL